MNLVASILAERSLLDYMPADTKLVAAGTDRWRARCPLTNGDRLSFGIRRHPRGHFVFRCFSCGEHGTVIDLVSKLERISARQAIVRLAAGTERMSPEAELQRSYDHFRTAQGAFVLACDAPGCGATKELPDALAAAIAMASGTNWEVAPDGVGALCPRHA